ncbi:Polygalacturonate 4-alpha-galacturonosyltransferase [Zea mays]|uniref:Polygalacturonate 4-alpha-galacturonosyltransferase n=1 Tax=Zea mays TaxID=4577 RepID=A0A3L6DXC6_MAIZE|nr:Polygalacturonate 4-alpha-galacturonosyltransferase [Zea mays]
MAAATAAASTMSLLPISQLRQQHGAGAMRRRPWVARRRRYVVPTARLFGPAIFEASKLKVLFLGVDDEAGSKQHGPLPRTYTLTHSDVTARLTLAVSHTINRAQLQGWYNRLQRDEVVAEWKKVRGRMSLHVHCHISGGHFLLDLIAGLRYVIFRKELPVVLKAFVHGDGDLFSRHPELEEATVSIDIFCLPADRKGKNGNQEAAAMKNLKSILPKEVFDAITASQQESGTLSVEFFRNHASPSWKTDDLVTEKSMDVNDNAKAENSLLEHSVPTNRSPKDPDEHQVDKAAKVARRKLREKRREKRAMDLVHKDDEARIKLENAAIERSKAVDSAVLGKYSIWRKENENENSDSTVRLMRDQIIMARVYSTLAKSKNKNDLYQKLQTRIRESQRAVGEANADADLHHSAPEKIRAMGQVLSKAREELYDCTAITQRIRAMLQSADEQVRSLKKQSTFLSQLAAKTIPNSIHCLSMRLTIDYYILPLEERKFPRSENLENPNLYHYALFSDNVLAASVVVNSTIMNAKEPEKHVFHLVTDKLNFGAMNMWFLLNPPGKATIHVENVDEFKWLNSSYCPVLRQLESAAMKEYYFKADRPTTLSAGSSNLKYRNPKYLSMLNHLRFYLPENEDRVLWKLGTLPPGLLTFYKLTHPLDKSWHVLGLGYNPSIDRSEIDNAAVVHYNGNMKPWLELAMTKYRPYWTKYIKYDHPYIRGCNLSE